MTLVVLVALASMSLLSGKLALAETPTRQFYLVGVGAGDPDLITLRAVKVIGQAQVVFCTDGIEQKYASYLLGKEKIKDEKMKRNR